MTSLFSSSISGMRWLIRADFTDQLTWDAVARSVWAGQPMSGDSAVENFTVIDDQEFDGLTPTGLLLLQPDQYGTFFLVDQLTLTHPERPLLAVDVIDRPGASFRLIPSEVEGFATNMLISNMDFADYSDSIDPDGIFRGFGTGPKPGPDSTDLSSQVEHRQAGVDLIADLRREADPDDGGSFIGQLIRERFWNPASWQRLDAGMREACRRYDHSTEVPRDLTAAFYSVMVRTPNLVADQGMSQLDPAALAIRLERIRILSAWFFRGWTLERCDDPLPDEYEPGGSHG